MQHCIASVPFQGDVLYQQTKHTFTVLRTRRSCLPQARKVFSQSHHLLFVPKNILSLLLKPVVGELGFELPDMLKGIVPALLQRRSNQPICRVNLLVAALRQLRFVLGALDFEAPLPIDRSLTSLKFFIRSHRYFDLRRFESLKNPFGYRFVDLGTSYRDTVARALSIQL